VTCAIGVATAFAVSPLLPCQAQNDPGFQQVDDYGSDTLLDRGRKAARERFRREERSNERHDRDDDSASAGDSGISSGFGVRILRASVDDFTGDEYASEDFLDLSLGRPDIRDMKDARDRRPLSDDAGVKDVAAVGPDAGDDTMALTGDEREELEPIENNLLDWVPAGADRKNNGGFGLGSFNGRPVPYRMNAHVGIERGYPWDPSM
jgi:hypothetical protein